MAVTIADAPQLASFPQDPNVGVLFYNGVTFDKLYSSKVTGSVVHDDATRTTKYMEWRIEVEGVVLLKPGFPNTDFAWGQIRQLLSAQGGPLKYVGNGFGGLNINVPGGLTDVAYGPVPNVIVFQPLGYASAAMIRWEVVVTIAEQPFTLNPGLLVGAVCQFNWDTSIEFDEEGYSSLEIAGTLEIPDNRINVNSRQIKAVVDDFRQKWLNIQIDLVNFKLPTRRFDQSRDKRTYSWRFSAREQSPMGLPWGCTQARGKMSVRELKKNAGSIALAGVRWQCTLTASYTVRRDLPPRIAAWAFFGLLSHRMRSSVFGQQVPGALVPSNTPQQPGPGGTETPTPEDRASVVAQLGVGFAAAAAQVASKGVKVTEAIFNVLQRQIFNSSVGAGAAVGKPPGNKMTSQGKSVVLTDFGFDEGLYDDSRSVSFHASWMLLCNFESIMIASGIWRWSPDTGGGSWAASMKDIAGHRSWLWNRINKNVDIIVDMGGGTPMPGAPVISELNPLVAAQLGAAAGQLAGSTGVR